MRPLELSTASPPRVRRAGGGSPARASATGSSRWSRTAPRDQPWRSSTTHRRRRSRRARRARRAVASRRPRDAARPDARRVPPIARRLSARVPGHPRSSTWSSPARSPFAGVAVQRRRPAARVRGPGARPPDSSPAGLDRGGADTPTSSPTLVERSAAPLRALLTNVARLARRRAADDARRLGAFAERTARHAGRSRRAPCSRSRRARRRAAAASGGCRSTSPRPSGSGRSSTRGARDEASRARLCVALALLVARPAPRARSRCRRSPAPVNDFAHVIDAASARELDRRIRALEAATRRRRRRRDGRDVSRRTDRSRSTRSSSSSSAGIGQQEPGQRRC